MCRIGLKPETEHSNQVVYGKDSLDFQADVTYVCTRGALSVSGCWSQDQAVLSAAKVASAESASNCRSGVIL